MRQFIPITEWIPFEEYGELIEVNRIRPKSSEHATYGNTGVEILRLQ